MITLVLVGCLANRIRAVFSTIQLAEQCNTTLKIIWFKDVGLNCCFHDLFFPINNERVVLEEASFLDYIIHDRPRKKNFWIPSLFQQVYFKRRMYDKEIGPRRKENQYFYACASQQPLYIATCYDFLHLDDPKTIHRLKPHDSIQLEIENVISSFGKTTYGIHIRRTDHVLSKKTSPTDSFIKQIKLILSENQQAMFYLATDDDNEKQLLKETFPGKIISSNKKADRNSSEGIKEALVEMFVLSNTKSILGSYGSTFSEMAALLGNIDLAIV